MPEDELCTRCHLCCTGALHAFTRVDEPDATPLLKLGGPEPLPAEQPAKLRVLQPCVAHALTRGDAIDAGCAIYDERPGVCRRYRCLLLRAVERGERSLEEASDVVELTVDLVSELNGHLGQPRTRALDRRLLEQLAGPVSVPAEQRQPPPSPNEIERERRMLLAVAKVQVMIRKHFVKAVPARPGDAAMSSEESGSGS